MNGNTHQIRNTKVTNKVDISDATKFVGKKDHFLANTSNKQALIYMIGDHLRQKGCHVIHAEGDADVGLCESSHYNVLVQVNNPHWRRHRSVGFATVSWSKRLQGSSLLV